MVQPRISLLFGIILTCVVVLCAGWLVQRNYSTMREITETELRLRWLSGEVMRLDEVLAMSAQMAAATGDPRWEARYRQHESELDARIKEVMNLAPDAYAHASAMDEANHRLVEMEGRSFVLGRAGDPRAAMALLGSAKYEEQKRICSDGMARINTALMRRTSTQLAAQKRAMQVSMLVGLGLCLVLAFLWMRVARALGQHATALGDAARELAGANESLERRVRERTAELNAAHESLKEETATRLKMEVELRQAQKLESVGRLAAGVAHEINAPVQFVGDSILFVRDSLAEEAADLPYLQENMPKALDRALEGLGRVASIVRSMKELAHPDSTEMTTVDLNRAVQGTLTIARNEYKYVAELETDFGELPPVLCYLGDLNQVILNIVVNAAQAIGDAVKGTDGKGCIRVRTHCEGDEAVISIADTGGGIPQEVQGRVFDPFFTTKTVGQGTGQGLSIARSVVVDRHGGQLGFETEVGKGTTFVIRLPIHGRESMARPDALPVG